MMRLFLIPALLVANLVVAPTAADVGNMVCLYDSSSFVREGPAQLSIAELDPALSFCNFLIYGYAGIDADTFKLKSLNEGLDFGRDHFRTITALKRKHPQLRVLLSVGGDRDTREGAPNHYMALLEDAAHRQAFVGSVAPLLHTYGFDGLDLAWQFPKNHPKAVKGAIKKAWSSFKSWFTGPKVVDEKAEEHKEQFTALVRELKAALRRDASLLTLTVLPHVDPALFVDVFTVIANVDFVNLAAFDFQTPERDPKVADYTAPLYELFERDADHNINHQVQFWLNQTAPSSKINVGVAAYGRTWQMTKDSGITGYPPIPDCAGPGPAGRQTGTLGLLSWPEICEKLLNPTNRELAGPEAPLRKVGDPTQRYGTYAYRAADENGEHGLWVSYEDPVSAATKAGYVHAKGLGGVAFFDLSMDDFRGQCAGEKFPLLRSIKFKL